MVESIVMSDMQTHPDGESGLPAAVTTSLYDLMTAMQATVPPEEDHLVVATVVHLWRSGRLAFVRQRPAILLPHRQPITWQTPAAMAGTAA
jgi:hypothetical protein